jgi:hypothetical protein
MSLKVRVTRDLIDYGDQRDPGNCAIANAIRLAHPHDFACVRVDTDEETGDVFIKYSDRRTGMRVCYEAPGTVKEWVPVFDTENKNAVPEIEFTARTVAWTKPMGRVSPLAKRVSAPPRSSSSRPRRPVVDSMRRHT